MAAVPSKPTRISTIKRSKPPEYVLKSLRKEIAKEADVENEEESGDRRTITNMEKLDLENFMDINPPKLQLKSLIDLSAYNCGELIKDPSKRLDRFALIEIKQALLIEIKS